MIRCYIGDVVNQNYYPKSILNNNWFIGSIHYFHRGYDPRIGLYFRYD